MKHRLIRFCASLLITPAVALPQDFTYVVRDGTVTITGYSGTNAEVIVPTKINDIPVRTIGGDAFAENSALTKVTLPGSITNIQNGAFDYCVNLLDISVDSSSISYSSADGLLFDKSRTTLVEYPAGKPETSYTIPNGIATIGINAFNGNTNLSKVTIPASLTRIEEVAFAGCRNLSSITIPSSVTYVGGSAFWYCFSLQGIFFEGNAPTNYYPSVSQILDGPRTIYYLPGMTGWDAYLADNHEYPAVLWDPAVQRVRVDQDGRFSFDITGATDIPVVVEASTDLSKGEWVELQKDTLRNGLLHFTDADRANRPRRFYHIRFP